MQNLNSILLEGNLVRDPEHITTPKGTDVCRFSVASNRFYRVEKETRSEVSFFEVETWNRQALRCAEQLSKGRGVRVRGRLKQDRWLDEEGKTRSRIKIVGDSVEFKPQFSRDAGTEATEAEMDAHSAVEADDADLENLGMVKGSSLEAVEAVAEAGPRRPRNPKAEASLVF